MLPYRVFKRFLSMKTTLDPSSIIFNYPNSRHQSLLLLSTPSQLNNITKKAIDDFQNPQMRPINQIIVACVDSILTSRNAYAELYLDSDININSYKTVDQFDKEEKLKPRDPLSVDPIKIDKNWKNKADFTSLEIKINNNSTNIKLANTLFVNGEHSTCFYIGDSDFDWQNLNELNVNLSINKNTDNEIQEESIKYFDRLSEIPLIENEAATNSIYQITDYEGNLIKSINNEPASSYLINNSQVMGSKKDLYFKLYDKSTDALKPWSHEYYKLLVGGLGWGEKQAFLGIDPVVGNAGNRFIKLYQFDKRKPSYDCSKLLNQTNTIVFECSEQEDGFRSHHEQVDSKETNEIVLDGVFGIGCEDGFELDGIWHRAQSQVIEIHY